MPQGDRTGPMGMGPMTGRRMGYCAGYDRPGFANQGFGGRGFGRGRGMGFRNFAPVQPAYPQQYSQPTKEQELQMLEDESKMIEQEQDALKKDFEEVKKRIAEIKKEK